MAFQQLMVIRNIAHISFVSAIRISSNDVLKRFLLSVLELY